MVATDAEHFFERCESLFVGQLTERERETLSTLRVLGLARVVYEGAAGLMGLGRVRRAEDLVTLDGDIYE